MSDSLVLTSELWRGIEHYRGKWTGKDVEGFDHRLISSVVVKRTWRGGVKARQAVFRMADLQTGQGLNLLWVSDSSCRGQLKCDGTRAETRLCLSAKRTSPFKSAGGRQFSWLLPAEVCASAVVMLDTPCSEVVWRVLATGSRGVHISGSNAGYTMFWGSVKGTGYRQLSCVHQR